MSDTPRSFSDSSENDDMDSVVFSVSSDDSQSIPNGSFASISSGGSNSRASSTAGLSSNISENTDMDEFTLGSDDSQFIPNGSFASISSGGSNSRAFSTTSSSRNRFCSGQLSNMSSAQTSTPRVVRRNVRSDNIAPAEAISNRAPEAVIDLCTPVRGSLPTETIDLDDSAMAPSTSRRRSHAPTGPTALDVEVGGPSSPKRKRTDQNESSVEAYKCTICFESVFRREPVTTKCGHVFCRECIAPIIRRMRKCPICMKGSTLAQLKRIYL